MGLEISSSKLEVIIFDLGILHKIRLNITEMDKTSSITKTRIRRSEWSNLVREMHNRETGISFTESKMYINGKVQEFQNYSR